MSRSDELKRFYEPYVEEHVPYHLSPRGWKRAALSLLPYWSYREWRFWDREVPRCDRLLDLGCARGREVFREKASWAAGVDVAGNALRDCRRNYDAALEADLCELPFADATFDCVVSSHVMGHVPAPEKDFVLREVFRVLRPGGSTLHVVETDSSSPMIELAKTERDLYQERLIDQDGHVGLELATTTVERFLRVGFEFGSAASLVDEDVHPRLTVKWFANGYDAAFEEFARLAKRSRRILANPVRLALEEIRLGRRPMPRYGDQRFDEALFVAAAFRKPGEP